ncbi:MAG: complement resistance protein TraT [Dehalococcoidia bacterium]
MTHRHWFVVGMVFMVIALTACAATVTALKHKDLEVQTKMSETIFLDPVPPEKRTVWVGTKNTSDKDVDLSPLRALIAAKGYRVVEDANSAHYLLQVNVLFVGKASEAAIDQSLRHGFGGPLVGMGAGALAGAAIKRTPGGAYAGAAVGGILGYGAEIISGSLVKAVTYTVITDLQLSERSDIPVSQQQTATLTQGTQTRVYQQVAEKTHWKRYRSRVASTATKVNLAFSEAKPVLVERLLKSLAGIL